MPADYEIRGDRIHVTLSGEVSFADLRTLYEARLVDENFRPGMTELVDARDAANVTASADDLWALRRKVVSNPTRFERVPLAVVVSATVVYGVSRMYQAMAATTERPMEIFTAIEEAEEWLETQRDPPPHH